MEIPIPSIVITPEQINAYAGYGKADSGDIIQSSLNFTSRIFSKDTPQLPQGTLWYKENEFIVIQIEPTVWHLTFSWYAKGSDNLITYDLPFPYLILIAKQYTDKGYVFFRNEPLRHLTDTLCHSIMTNVKDTASLCYYENNTSSENHYITNVLNTFNGFFASKFSNGSYHNYNALLPLQVKQWLGKDSRDIWIDGEKFFSTWEKQSLDSMLQIEYTPFKKLSDFLGLDQPVSLYDQLQNLPKRNAVIIHK